MARTEARILCSIWDGEDYRALSVEAQWLYQAVLSQKDLSACGVLTWAPGRFARLSRTLTKKRVESARVELQTARYAVVDEETDELWARTFLKHDGVLAVPNMVVSMSHAFCAVHSEPIRQGLVEQLTPGFYEGLAQRFPKGWQEGLHKRLAEGFKRQLGEPLASAARADLPAGPYSLLPTPPPPLTPPPVGSTGKAGAPSGVEEEEFPGPTNDQPTPRAVADAVALRKLARRQGPPISDRRRWLAKVAGDLLDESGDEIEMLLAVGRTAEQAAALLDPDPAEAELAKRRTCCRSSAGGDHEWRCDQHPTRVAEAADRAEAEAARAAVGS